MNKEQQYQQVVKQVLGLIEGETFEVAVLANVAAALREAFDHFFWVGFYLVRDEKLLLGPFQGPVACYRIARGRGVCGTAWDKKETLIVPDVEQFSGHIACSSLSRSEIVVPLFDSSHEVKAVLDIDSTSIASFDDVDGRYLQELARGISRQLYR